MKYSATQKFLLMSPQKVREVAGLVRGLSPSQALEALPFVSRAASGPLEKVLKTAVANARQAGADPAGMRIKELQVGEGPRLKRYRFASRGRVHGYRRRMSHIRIVLENNSEARDLKPKSSKK